MAVYNITGTTAKNGSWTNHSVFRNHPKTGPIKLKPNWPAETVSGGTGYPTFHAHLRRDPAGSIPFAEFAAWSPSQRNTTKSAVLSSNASSTQIPGGAHPAGGGRYIRYALSTRVTKSVYPSSTMTWSGTLTI